ncbi:hypothetical protein [Roseomonas indoligenes]|uniref:Uncharacterized protein n=1 Tax=Roseomonas indoligenes TaxID=2820811 RepID=A0A940N294_9PROT|nr:hypothetical protein [Pararoseomonas indoligenes]MBP0495420.1 hypothetical protein [Pararoseomonas indoligenes]
MGYDTLAQHPGQVLGPLAVGFVGGHVGMPDMFIGRAVIVFGGAAFIWVVSRQAGRPKSEMVGTQ